MDVGTGSGSWCARLKFLFDDSYSIYIIRIRAMDMAKEFPHCDVVGVDLVPPRVTA